MKLIVLLSILISNFAWGALIPSSFAMEFEQVHKSISKKKKKITQVTLDYKYPSQVVLNSGKGGFHTSYTSNGKTSWYYTAPFMPEEPGEVVIHSKNERGIFKFFDSLRKGLDKNDFFSYRLKGKDLIFTFKKKGISELSLIQAVFTSKKKKKIELLTLSDFSELSFTESNNKKVQLLIKSLDDKKKFNSRHFFFKAPENTKVIQR